MWLTMSFLFQYIFPSKFQHMNSVASYLSPTTTAMKRALSLFRRFIYHVRQNSVHFLNTPSSPKLVFRSPVRYNLDWNGFGEVLRPIQPYPQHSLTLFVKYHYLHLRILTAAQCRQYWLFCMTVFKAPSNLSGESRTKKQRQRIMKML